MATKMPTTLEVKFLHELKKIAKKHKAHWVQTRHIVKALFGESLTYKELHRNRNRVYRLANKLEAKGLIATKKRYESPGESTGKVLVQYYHPIGVDY